MERFSDFAPSQHQLEGDKMPLDDVVNKEIIVTSFNISKSKFSNGDGLKLTLQFELKGVKHILFTSSAVLRKQCEEYKDKIPFITTVKHIHKYYTFA